MDSLFKRAQSKSFIFLSVLNLACPNRPPPSMSRGTAFSVQQNYRYSFLYSKRSHGYNWVFVSTVKPFTSYHPLGEKRQPRVKRVKSPYMTSRITALILTIWWMKSKDYKGKRMFFNYSLIFFYSPKDQECKFLYQSNMTTAFARHSKCKRGPSTIKIP